MSTANTPLAIMAARANSLQRPVGPTPWRDVPEFGEYIHVRGSIECPVDGTGYFTVAQFTVQAGYAAVLTHLLFNFFGTTPPVEGDSTSILYGLRVDGYGPRDFGTINCTLGSLTHGPYPIPGALRLKGGQIVQGVVQVPAGSGVSTGPGNSVLCHLLGYQWLDQS